jgi:hypothetical protein
MTKTVNVLTPPPPKPRPPPGFFLVPAPVDISAVCDYDSGVRIDAIIGPWFSLGFHIDFQHRHVDLHVIWWIITIGNTVESVHCGYCNAEINEDTSVRPACSTKL